MVIGSGDGRLAALPLQRLGRARDQVPEDPVLVAQRSLPRRLIGCLAGKARGTSA